MAFLDHDPRVTPARADLAARFLEGRVQADRFADGRPAQVVAASAPVRRSPSPTARLDTQVLFGETVQVYERKDGWAWLQADADGYVGYAPEMALSETVLPVTATVRTLRSFVFPEPDLKAPPLDALSLTAQVRVTQAHGAFSAIARGEDPVWGYMFTDHLSVPGHTAPDFVAEAERFLGVPYLWGGKDSLGLDCSGLVQTALARTGVRAPRDSDMQEAALGTALDCPSGRLADLMRGDLVFWKGHVGIMVDSARMLHANATHMAVTIDDLAAFAGRIAPRDGPITHIRRMPAGL
ncbi:MAG: NlpC/P60 family protein [Alphaproteobacteria bacterium]